MSNETEIEQIFDWFKPPCRIRQTKSPKIGCTKKRRLGNGQRAADDDQARKRPERLHGRVRAKTYLAGLRMETELLDALCDQITPHRRKPRRQAEYIAIVVAIRSNASAGKTETAV